MSEISNQNSQQPTTDIVRKIFDAAISMPYGSKIPLTFSSESQRESFRVRFHNEKRRYAEAVGEIEANTILCAKQTINNKFHLFISKTQPMSTPFIVSPDGSVTEIDLTEPISPSITITTDSCIPEQPEATTTLNLGSGAETPDQRRQRLMQKDKTFEPEK